MEVGKLYTLTISHRIERHPQLKETIYAIIKNIEMLGDTGQYKSIVVDQIIGIDKYLEHPDSHEFKIVERKFYRSQIQGIGQGIYIP